MKKVVFILTVLMLALLASPAVAAKAVTMGDFSKLLEKEKFIVIYPPVKSYENYCRGVFPPDLCFSADDVRLTAKMTDGGHLVLIGNPEENKFVKAFAEKIGEKCAIRFVGKGIAIGPDKYDGKNIGWQFIAAHPASNGKMVFFSGGNSFNGFTATFFRDNSDKSYMIMTPDALLRWGVFDVSAAGWKIEAGKDHKYSRELFESMAKYVSPAPGNHFILRYNRDSSFVKFISSDASLFSECRGKSFEETLKIMIDMKNECFAKTLKKLGISFDGMIEIVLFDNDKQARKMIGDAGGCVDIEHRQVFYTGLKVFSVHEETHILMNGKDYMKPFFITEGIAKYMDESFNFGDDIYSAAYRQMKEKKFAVDPFSDCDALAGSFVRYLVEEKGGMEIFRKFFDGLGALSELDAQLVKYYKADSKKINKDFVKFVRAKVEGAKRKK